MLSRYIHYGYMSTQFARTSSRCRSGRGFRKDKRQRTSMGRTIGKIENEIPFEPLRKHSVFHFELITSAFAQTASGFEVASLNLRSRPRPLVEVVLASRLRSFRPRASAIGD